MVTNKRRFYLPTEVNFGKGSVEVLSSITTKDDVVFLVSDYGVDKAGITKIIEEKIEQVGAKITKFNRVEPNPTADLVQEALQELKKSSATMVIAVGGGSSMDLGKIVAALATNEGKLSEYQWNGRPFEKNALPFIAIPTTAGTGSEVTKVAVIVDKNLKKGINSDKLYPQRAIVDPMLMAGLPSRLTASTGMDALSHAVEAYVGINANSFTDAYAIEAVRLIKKSLRKACVNGSHIEAREDMALASTLAGIAMDQAGLGIVHSMASPFCGIFHMAHGDANAVLLKYGMEFNLEAAPERFANLATALGCDTSKLSIEEAAKASVNAVSELVEEIGLKIDLSSYGFTVNDADMVAEETLKMFLLKNNPRRPTYDQCKDLYLNILKGEGV